MNNEYCNWFEKADLTLDEVRYFVVQFSVLSNLLLVAQIKKKLNAFDLDEMHASREILANEIGAIFRAAAKEPEVSWAKRIAGAENEGNPDLVNTEGTVDGWHFKFKAAHFEWLLLVDKRFGLTF